MWDVKSLPLVLVVLSLSIGCGAKELGAPCDDADECGADNFCESPDDHSAKICVSDCPCPDEFRCVAGSTCVRECGSDADCSADGTACNKSTNPNFLGLCVPPCTEESSCVQGACAQGLEDDHKFCA